MPPVGADRALAEDGPAAEGPAVVDALDLDATLTLRQRPQRIRSLAFMYSGAIFEASTLPH